MPAKVIKNAAAKAADVKKVSPKAVPNRTPAKMVEAGPAKVLVAQPVAPAATKPAGVPVAPKPAVAPAKPAPAANFAAARPAVVAAAPAPGAGAAGLVPGQKPTTRPPGSLPRPPLKPGMIRPQSAMVRPGLPPRPLQPPKPAVTPKSVVADTMAAAKKPPLARNGFKTNEFIVYPAHGVGRIVAIEEQEIAGIKLELFVIQFEKDKMTLRVPTGKCLSVGMRKLAEDDTVKRAMDTLKGKARIKRTMWSRRAQEYEAKINSGDLIAIAEVVRDLYRSESQPEQSYSERQLYEAALDRMAREIAAVEKLDERGAVQRITEVLAKSAKARKPAEETADGAETQAA